MRRTLSQLLSMRRFWFAVSLALVFIFTASASYIFFALSDGRGDERTDEPYQLVGAPVANWAVEVKTIPPEAQVSLSELYTLCGHTVEQEQKAEALGLADKSYDELALQGWAVAQTGELSLALNRQLDELCPVEADQRILQRTERGLAVYEGTLEYPGRLLLEMPADVSAAELPPDFVTSLENGGYQVSSQTELDELLESLDELIDE